MNAQDDFWRLCVIFCIFKHEPLRDSLVRSHILLQYFIGSQQLDFLGNCQCRLNFLDNMHIEARAQVPIFDTTQMGYLSIVGTWTLLPFRGAL